MEEWFIYTLTLSSQKLHPWHSISVQDLTLSCYLRMCTVFYGLKKNSDTDTHKFRRPFSRGVISYKV